MDLEDKAVVAELDGLSVVSVLRVDGDGPSPAHAYEVHSDGVVLGTLPTLRDTVGFLQTEGF